MLELKSCLRIVTLLLLRGGNGGPGWGRDIRKATWPSRDSCQVLILCSWPMRICHWAAYGAGVVHPSRAELCPLSALSPLPVCSGTLCQGERKSFGGEEEGGVKGGPRRQGTVLGPGVVRPLPPLPGQVSLQARVEGGWLLTVLQRQLLSSEGIISQALPAD